MTPQEILLLIGLLAQDAQAFLQPGSEASKGVQLGADTVAALSAALQRHAQNAGLPIEEVLKTL